MKNIQIQYGFIKGRELDELQKVCLDRAGKSVNIRTLQQKLDNVSLSRAVEKWKNIPEIQRVLTRECISPTKGRELDVLQQELFESNEQRNKLQQKLFASKEQKNEMNMLQQKLLESNQQIGMLQQKLDQNVSQIELEQIMLQQASLQMNTLQQAEDRENIRKLELENAKYKDKLENAKYNFRKRKNEMLNMLDSTNPSGLEKNGYNNIWKLLCNCEQAWLPKIEGKDAAVTLQEYYDNFTYRNVKNINPFTIIGSAVKSVVTNVVTGSNKSKYLTAINFLREERVNHINKIQGLEKSIKDSAIPYCIKLDNLLI